jgi:prolyl-tRNA editing enzyme YbaK/EbsC (Cys-tRNA(Pro) deacylase)
MRRVVEEGMQDGSIAPGDPRLIAFTLAGALNWIARWYDPNGPMTPEEIAAGCVTTEQQAKSIFLRVKRAGEKRFAVLTIQAQKRADLRRAAALLGGREAKMATREQLEQQTGCTFRELTPFGRHPARP